MLLQKKDLGKRGFRDELSSIDSETTTNLVDSMPGSQSQKAAIQL